MKTTGSVQEKNGRFYFVINLYDAHGKRKIKWISTGLTVRGNKRKAESMLRQAPTAAPPTRQQVGDAVSGLSQRVGASP